MTEPIPFSRTATPLGVAPIHRSETVHQQADKSTPYAAAIANPEAAHLADEPEWTGVMLVSPAQWRLPAGAGNTDKSGTT